jgi:hypothetical protein
MQNPVYERWRIQFPETTWEIPEGVPSALLWRQEAADRDSLDPSWPLSEPRFGIHSEYPNCFSRQFGE